MNKYHFDLKLPKQEAINLIQDKTIKKDYKNSKVETSGFHARWRRFGDVKEGIKLMSNFTDERIELQSNVEYLFHTNIKFICNLEKIDAKISRITGDFKFYNFYFSVIFWLSLSVFLIVTGFIFISLAGKAGLIVILFMIFLYLLTFIFFMFRRLFRVNVLTKQILKLFDGYVI